MRERTRRALLALACGALLATGCAQANTVAAADTPPPPAAARTRPTTAVTGTAADAGPPPITALVTTQSFLDSPVAVPNDPAGAGRTANTLASEALAALPEPDPADRVGAPAPGDEVAAADGADGEGGDSGDDGSTLVAQATVPTIEARTAPELLAEPLAAFAHPTERGVPLVFQVLQGPVDGWVEVLLPVRPNGTTGWIQADEVDLTRNRYAIDLDVSRHELTVFRDGEALITTQVAVGTGATPTPIGRFYLTELLRPPEPNGVYGPFAYGLSGFSETLDSFNGGPGIIGIHGTNRPDLLGTDVSHGCIRVDNDVITELSTFLPLGTPVSIHRAVPERDPSRSF
ncbi:MAG: L,D-transpeptidase [Actinomycetota bacterium]